MDSVLTSILGSPRSSWGVTFLVSDFELLVAKEEKEKELLIEIVFS